MREDRLLLTVNPVAQECQFSSILIRSRIDLEQVVSSSYTSSSSPIFPKVPHVS